LAGESAQFYSGVDNILRAVAAICIGRAACGAQLSAQEPDREAATYSFHQTGRIERRTAQKARLFLIDSVPLRSLDDIRLSNFHEPYHSSQGDSLCGTWSQILHTKLRTGADSTRWVEIYMETRFVPGNLDLDRILAAWKNPTEVLFSVRPGTDSLQIRSNINSARFSNTEFLILHMRSVDDMARAAQEMATLSAYCSGRHPVKN
jgi:hypothetical protein